MEKNGSMIGLKAGLSQRRKNNMRKVEKMVPAYDYIAEDGTIFSTEKECIEYEEGTNAKEHIIIYDKDFVKLPFDNYGIYHSYLVIFTSKEAAAYYHKFSEEAGLESPFDNYELPTTNISSFVYDGEWIAYAQFREDRVSIVEKIDAILGEVL